jgi:invasion protein IalB
LSDGSTAIFVVFKTPEEGIGIPVSLNGFKDGFTNLP